MDNLYFVINPNGHFLAKDGNFYSPFVKMAFGVKEPIAEKYVDLGYCKEHVDPDKFPALYKITFEAAFDDTTKAQSEPPALEKRRTYVRCSTFALAAVLDQLYDTRHVYNVWISLEDGDFLVSFEYLRDWERHKDSIGSSVSEAKAGSNR